MIIYENIIVEISGTWIQIRSNVKSATINYLGVIYVIDNDNLVFKIKNEKSIAM